MTDYFKWFAQGYLLRISNKMKGARMKFIKLMKAFNCKRGGCKPIKIINIDLLIIWNVGKTWISRESINPGRQNVDCYISRFFNHSCFYFAVLIGSALNSRSYEFSNPLVGIYSKQEPNWKTISYTTSLYWTCFEMNEVRNVMPHFPYMAKTCQNSIMLWLPHQLVTVASSGGE